MTTLSQPTLVPNDPTENKKAVQAHRDAVLQYAREHEGEWVLYWESPTKVSARKVKSNLKPFTVGRYPVTTKGYVMHGTNHVDKFSMRLVGTRTEIRYNGPYLPGSFLVPDEDDPGVLIDAEMEDTPPEAP